MGRTNTNTFQPSNTRAVAYAFATSDGTTIKTVGPAGGADSLLKTLLLTNSETATDHIVSLWLNIGGGNFLIDAIKVPAMSGMDGVHPAVDGLANAALRTEGPGGKKFLDLPSGTFLNASVDAAVGAGKAVTVLAVMQDY
jgi:hypothetical protein